MVNIKRQQIKAYILLESLIALALLATITTFVLSNLTDSQKQIQAYNRRIEELNTAQMALSAEQGNLAINDVSVNLSKSDNGLSIRSDGKEILKLEIQQVKT